MEALVYHGIVYHPACVLGGPNLPAAVPDGNGDAGAGELFRHADGPRQPAPTFPGGNWKPGAAGGRKETDGVAAARG